MGIGKSKGKIVIKEQDDSYKAFTHHLPQEMWMIIISYLDWIEIASFSQVCRYLYFLCQYIIIYSSLEISELRWKDRKFV